MRYTNAAWLASAALLLLSAHHPARADSSLRGIHEYRWEKRIILVLAGDHADGIVSELEGASAALEDRHVYWFILDGDEVHTNSPDRPDAAFAEKTRSVYFDGFDTPVVLAGKDGDVKRRSAAFDLPSMFALIDSMPMRRAEMREARDEP